VVPIATMALFRGGTVVVSAESGAGFIATAAIVAAASRFKRQSRAALFIW